VHGIAETARALRLDAKRLAKRVGEIAALVPTSAVEPAAFVELGGFEVSDARKGAVIELVGREGDRLRVEVVASAVDLVALARAFWSRRA
jgi:hypothetical protein